MSVRTRDNNKAVVYEALRRCKYKFPGRQKIIISNKWGFTKLTREEYVERKAAGTLLPDECYVKFNQPEKYFQRCAKKSCFIILNKHLLIYSY
jgi:hypothetical protein